MTEKMFENGKMTTEFKKNCLTAFAKIAETEEYTPSAIPTGETENYSRPAGLIGMRAALDAWKKMCEDYEETNAENADDKVGQDNA